MMGSPKARRSPFSTALMGDPAAISYEVGVRFSHEGCCGRDFCLGPVSTTKIEHSFPATKME